MRIFVHHCGGILGPALVAWLLANSDASITGTDMSHDRLVHLLSTNRFNYYVVGGPDTQLIDRLIADAHVVVDLRAIEVPTNNEPDADEVAEQIRLHHAFVATCVRAQVRLVHVASAADADAPPPARSPNGTAHRLEGDPDADQDGNPSGSVESSASIDLDRAHSQLTEQLIQTYGDSAGLDYTIVRVSPVISERLDVLPRAEDLPPHERLCRALAHGEASPIAIHQDDLREQTFVYIADVEECLGRIVLDDEGWSSQEIITIGNPENRASPADLARLVLQRYRERYWDGYRPLPVFAVDYLNPGRSPRVAQPPNIEKAVELLGWTPEWSLADAVDEGLAHLFPRSVPRPPQS